MLTNQNKRAAADESQSTLTASARIKRTLQKMALEAEEAAVAATADHGNAAKKAYSDRLGEATVSLQNAQNAKNSGNSLFKRQDYAGAKAQYVEGIHMVRRYTGALLAAREMQVPAVGEEEAAEHPSEPTAAHWALRCVLYSNRAEVNLQLRLYEEAESDATEALGLDPLSEKSRSALSGHCATTRTAHPVAIPIVLKRRRLNIAGEGKTGPSPPRASRPPNQVPLPLPPTHSHHLTLPPSIACRRHAAVSHL